MIAKFCSFWEGGHRRASQTEKLLIILHTLIIEGLYYPKDRWAFHIGTVANLAAIYCCSEASTVQCQPPATLTIAG